MIPTKRLTTAAVISLLLFYYFYKHDHRISFSPTYAQPPVFLPGQPKASGNYTRTVVIGHLASEDISWLSELPPSTTQAIYTIDGPPSSSSSPSPYTIPRNKGHESMVYLTYLIDHYANLSDTTIFLHPHATAWHNNDLLASSTVATLAHLSDAHVARTGYFNTRCHHEPGCPDWLHLDRPPAQLDAHRKMEEQSFSPPVWRQLHPTLPLPSAISQPCCAQFAVSKARILALPRSEYLRYRDWLLHTPLSDTLSGRIMEYTWHTIFTGQAELCPAMHACYCDGYGVCFGGPAPLAAWLGMRDEARARQTRLVELESRGGTAAEIGGLRREIAALDAALEQGKNEALERGREPRNRAEECGRGWTEGDGF